MSSPFDFFVIFGAMRTGSNFLEETLGTYEGLVCHGELFNPLFIGREGQKSLFGLSLDERDRDPMAMVARMVRATGATPGFRLFPGHDQRVLESCLADRRCAKIVLARNPVDSYVSLKIARKTGRWWTDGLGGGRPETVRFEPEEFVRFLVRLQDFYGHVRRALQTTGQSAFHIHYEDLADPAVRDGLARWLGATGPARGEAASRVQNPEPLETKVENFAEMAEWLGRADAFDLFRIPDLEPRRGPNVPAWLASDTLGLLFTPLAGGPTARVAQWLERAGGTAPVSGWTRKSLRKWMRRTQGHRSFTVVTHPLRRAHDAFRNRICSEDPDSAFADIRFVLRQRYGLGLLDGTPETCRDSHRAAFMGFLQFVKGNLAGQTSVRVPSIWASQAGLVRGLSEIAPPDMILRAETLAALASIYDAEIEAAAREAFARDYVTFGYGSWR
jgi:LPS sulfotransferase NodH